MMLGRTPSSLLRRALLFSSSRIGEGLDQALPCLTDLILTNNSLVELVSERGLRRPTLLTELGEAG